MIEFLIDVWSSMDSVKFFYIPACCCLLLGLVCLFRSFFGKGVRV